MFSCFCLNKKKHKGQLESETVYRRKPWGTQGAKVLQSSVGGQAAEFCKAMSTSTRRRTSPATCPLQAPGSCRTAAAAPPGRAQRRRTRPTGSCRRRPRRKLPLLSSRCRRRARRISRSAPPFPSCSGAGSRGTRGRSPPRCGAASGSAGAAPTPMEKCPTTRWQRWYCRPAPFRGASPSSSRKSMSSTCGRSSRRRARLASRGETWSSSAFPTRSGAGGACGSRPTAQRSLFGAKTT
mmetsp:Transcript_19524/g.46637  ORF Transcript_19524/g.46637 Transcript_19524/m.46637 type:complete len:238 (-) Transcript_19524:491-1204(-)